MDPRLRARAVSGNGIQPGPPLPALAGPPSFLSIQSGVALSAALETLKRDSPIAVQKIFCIVCASNNVSSGELFSANSLRPLAAPEQIYGRSQRLGARLSHYLKLVNIWLTHVTIAVPTSRLSAQGQALPSGYQGRPSTSQTFMLSELLTKTCTTISQGKMSGYILQTVYSIC